MAPWRQRPDERLALPDGSELPLEIRGVPARHRDLWIVLHEPTQEIDAVRYLLRRFREKASVVVVPDLSGLLGPGGEAVGQRALSALDAVEARFGTLSGRLFLIAFSAASGLAGAWACRKPGRMAGLVLLGPEVARCGVALEQDPKTQALLVCEGTGGEHGVELLRRAAGPVELVVLPSGESLFPERWEALFDRIRAFWRSAAPRPARPKRVRDPSRPKTRRRKRKARGQ